MRIRTIKPAFFVNDELAECHPLARLLFIGLWCAADRDGRLEDRPRRLKAELLPYDDADIDALLRQLEQGGFVVRYQVNGLRCIQIINFTRHQRISGKEADTPSELPPPGEQSGNNRETTPPPVTDAGEALGKQRGSTGEAVEMTGREGKVIEGNGVCGETKRGSRATPTRREAFKPPSLEEVKLAAAKIGLPENEAVKFHAHFMSNGWKVGGRTPMRSYQHALIKWKCTWEEKRHEHTHHSTTFGHPGANPRNAAMGVDEERRSREICNAIAISTRLQDEADEREAREAAEAAQRNEPGDPGQ